MRLTAEDAAVVRFGVALLPEREQELIRRRYWQEQSAAQVGTAMRLPTAAVSLWEDVVLDKLRWWLLPMMCRQELARQEARALFGEAAGWA